VGSNEWVTVAGPPLGPGPAKPPQAGCTSSGRRPEARAQAEYYPSRTATPRADTGTDGRHGILVETAVARARPGHWHPGPILKHGYRIIAEASMV
jgi:hypothetical protein